MVKKIAYVGLAVLFLGVTFFSYRFYSLGIESQNTKDSVPGITDGKIAACGEKPNCVSSLSKEADFAIQGFEMAGDSGAKFLELVAALAEEEGVSLVKKTDSYAHLTYQSKIFGFTDDLELHLHPELGKVDVRSSSRVGYSDLGANRKRVEGIREKYFGENGQ